MRDGRVTVARYWQLDSEPSRRITEDEAAEALPAELRNATRLRLISDVPLGAFLSGGIDSSTVVALMAQRWRPPDQDVLDRLRRRGVQRAAVCARQVARALSAPTITSSSSGPTRAAILPKLVWHYNEPYADSSAIPTYYLARETRAAT